MIKQSNRYASFISCGSVCIKQRHYFNQTVGKREGQIIREGDQGEEHD